VGILYRAGQFFQALTARPTPEDLQTVQQFLSPALMVLFLQMQPSEQAHSLQIYRQLIQMGEHDADLLSAALLHDVGKTRSPLRLWERVLIVITINLFPKRVKSWGQSSYHGWRRPFIVAEQHPAWGAEMAAEAGASLLTVALIQRHQDPALQRLAQSREDILLQRLQHLDNES
jgi:hypothetical protein